MRAVSSVAAPLFACAIVAIAVTALAACQDTHSSNEERDTHMGDLRAAPAASPEPSTPFAALPPVPPVAGSSIAASPLDAGPGPSASAAKDAGAHPAVPHPTPLAPLKP